MRGEKLRRSWSRESNHVIDPLQLNGTSLPDSHEHRWRRGTVSQNAMTWEGQAIANKGQGELYCSPWCHCHALLFQRPHALLNDKNSTKIGTKTPNSQGPRYRRRIRHGEGWSYWCASNNGVFRTTPRLPSTSPSPCFFFNPISCRMHQMQRRITISPSTYCTETQKPLPYFPLSFRRNRSLSVPFTETLGGCHASRLKMLRYSLLSIDFTQSHPFSELSLSQLGH